MIRGLTKIICYCRLLIIFFTVVAFSCTVWASPLLDAANKAVKDLDRRVPLDGLVIQLNQDSFRRIGDNRSLELSTSLNEVFSAALARKGAQVSMREQGEEPLRLLGNYEVGDEQVVLTVRLRSMGKAESTDLAVSQVSFDLDDIAGTLVNDSLEKAAESLVRELEQATVLVEDARFEVSRSVPAVKGKPTLKLGTAFRDEVLQAIQTSELFGSKSFGVEIRSHFIVPSYELEGDKVHLMLELILGKRIDGSGVQTTIDRSMVGAELLKPFDDRSLQTCLTISAPGRRYIKSGSRQAEALVSVLQHLLLQHHSIKAGGCQEGVEYDRRIDLQMKTTSRKTADGFGFISGQLQGNTYDGSGRLLGSMTASGRVNQAVSDSDKTALYEKVLSDSAIEELARVVLIQQ